MAAPKENFSLTIAKSIYESNEEFPVDLDDAWRWIGYTQKVKALKALISDDFEEGLDWNNTFPAGKDLSSKPGQPIKKYFLTGDCFKMLAMVARTRHGKEVRKYFLQCEKEAIGSRAWIAGLQTEIAELRAINGSRGLVSEVAAIWTELGPWSSSQAQLLTDRLISQAIGAPLETLEAAADIAPTAVELAPEPKPEEPPVDVETTLKQEGEEKKETTAKRKRGKADEERLVCREEPLMRDRVRLKSPKNKGGDGFIIIETLLPVGTSAHERYQIEPYYGSWLEDFPVPKP